MSQICDSYSETNYSSSYPFILDSWEGVGQAFSGNGGKLEYAQFYLKRGNNPFGNAYAKVYNIMWTFGSSAVPLYGSDPLAISDPVDVSTISEDVFSLTDFIFSGDNQIQLGATTKYCLTFECDVEWEHPNYIYLAADYTTPTHSGNLCRKSPGFPWGYDADHDTCFYVYTDIPKFIEIIGNNTIISAPR